MKKNRISDIVTKLAAPIIEKNDFELVDIEFKKEGAQHYLRVFIDKAGGINVNDCQLVSEELSKGLDEKDPIDQNYILEVSSPGVERPLKKDKDFQRFIGSDVNISLYRPINGKKEYEGELKGLVDGFIIINCPQEGIVKFSKDHVALVKLAFKF